MVTVKRVSTAFWETKSTVVSHGSISLGEILQVISRIITIVADTRHNCHLHYLKALLPKCNSRVWQKKVMATVLSKKFTKFKRHVHWDLKYSLLFYRFSRQKQGVNNHIKFPGCSKLLSTVDKLLYAALDCKPTLNLTEACLAFAITFLRQYPKQQTIWNGTDVCCLCARVIIDLIDWLIYCFIWLS